MTDAIVRPTSVPPPPPALSLRGKEEARSDVVREFLGFVLAHEAYAIPLSSVREILKAPPITEVPRAPRYVLGIISVRGRVITVVDLRRRLKLPEGPPTKQTRVLLVEHRGELLGLLVDCVLQVFRLREDEMEMAATVGGDTAEYVMGVGRPKSVRGVGRAREGAAPLQSEFDILILLDPVPLLGKR